MKLATIGSWKGQPQWKCSLCGFSTLSDLHMTAHIKDGHRVTVAYIEIPAVKTEPVTEPAETTDKKARVQP